MIGYRLRDKWVTCRNDKETYIAALRALHFRAGDPDSFFQLLRDACKTSCRTFFSQTPEGLFLRTPSLTGNAANYERVVPGWYADTNLSNKQKERNLSRACDTLGIRFPEELEVRFAAGHYSPKSAEEAAREVQALFKELEEWLAGPARPA